jgi:hypothetical protein
MLDPGGISNWSVTYVDWSERRWHPKTYRARDVSLKLLKNITVMLQHFIQHINQARMLSQSKAGSSSGLSC